MIWKYLLWFVVATLGWYGANCSLTFPTAQPTYMFPAKEYSALFDLYNTTNGPNWNWKEVTIFGNKWKFEPIVNPCTNNWQGLVCSVVDGVEHVTGIKLNDYRMTGKLPDSISNFTALTTLNISRNNLFGTLTPYIGQLSELQVLTMEFNQFDGTIPVELANCSQLLELWLNHNNFIGTIPKELAAFKQLVALNIEQNSMFGSIPYEFGFFEHLEIMSLNQNELIGSIPDSFNNLVNLRNLELNNNNLNGSIPSRLGELNNIQFLILSNNDLTGTIPTSFGSFPHLRTLNLGNNRLHGTIPDVIGNLTSLNALDLSLNLAIVGTLPMILSQLTGLNALYLEGNFLFGSIPSAYGALTKILHFEIFNNYLTGTIPKELAYMTELTDLSLSNNRLEGSIPLEILTLSKLDKLSLSSNRLNGTLPALLGNVTSLTQLDLSNNSFSGPIPPELGNLFRLNTLSLSFNNFNSSIPPELCTLNRLTALTLNNNKLTSSIPRMIRNLTVLQTIDLYNNLLTGTLPIEISELKALTTLHVSNNFLSKALPDWLGDLTIVSELALQSNMFTGSIPSRIGNLTLLNVFTAFENQLTGTIPYQLTENENKILQYFAVDFNDLWGTIPEDLYNLQLLSTFVIKNNKFTGTIPSNIGNITVLKYFDISHNTLSGTLPSELSNLRVLEVFFVFQNIFTGNLYSFVNSEQQIKYSNIDVSNNFFTGKIPTEPFKIKSFETFAAVTNCLTGTLPVDICQAEKLTSLALDGISTANVCRHRYLKISGLPHTYGLKYHIHDGIPKCLFNMTKLQTLHLSGNGINARLPDDLVIGHELMDLSLSYNVLSGTIPKAIQEHKWSNLDLSYNKFTGELSPQLVNPESAPYSLKVNRISGVIPQSLMNATNISVLTGNIFACPYSLHGKHDLPQHDSGIRSYSCGSNSANVSLFVWCGCAIIGLIICVGCFSAYNKHFPVLFWVRGKMDLMTKWLSVFQVDEEGEETNIHVLGIFMKDLQKMFAGFALFMLLIACPVYVGLSFTFNTYYHEYAWSLGATYLSGFAPAFLILCICTTILIFLIYESIVTVKFSIVEFVKRPTMLAKNKYVYMPLCALLIMTLINMTITISVNVGFVLATLQYDSNVIVMIQLSMAFFKVVWNEIVLRSIIYCEKYFHTLNGEPNKTVSILIPSCLLLFNGIVCPCLATLLLSPDCFYSVIVAPDQVTASYQYSVCDEVHTNSRSVCTSDTTVTASTSYLPPFNYSYQCSSSLVSNYASVYVFIFLIKTFALPTVLVMLKGLDHLVHKAGGKLGTSQLGKFLSGILPDFLRSIDQLESLAKARYTLFFKEIFTIRCVYICGLLLTFGVMFPPVALTAAINVFSLTLCTQLILGRLIYNADRHEVGVKYRKIIERDCHEIANLFWSSIYPLIPLVSIFYSFFVYDTYGDVVGWQDALWLVLITMFMPLILLIAFYAYQWKFPIARRIIKRRHTGKSRSNTLRGDSVMSRFSMFKLSVFHADMFNEHRMNENENDIVEEDIEMSSKRVEEVTAEPVHIVSKPINVIKYDSSVSDKNNVVVVGSNDVVCTNMNPMQKLEDSDVQK